MIDETWPLHTKAVKGFRVEDMDKITAPTSRTWDDMKRWLTDKTIYAKPEIVSSKLPTSNLSAADEKALEEAGFTTAAVRKGMVTGVRMFKVAEVTKKRFRAIMWTQKANDFYDKNRCERCSVIKTSCTCSEPSPRVRFKSKREDIEDALAGECAITLDFKSYYNQFILGKELQNFFVYADKGGNKRALTRLPTGMRQSVAIAVAATDRLLDFPRTNVKTGTCIDNIRFVGKQDDVVRAAAELVRRCKIVGVEINDLPVDANEEDLRRLVHRKGEWLGVEIDYTNKLQRLGKKVLHKLQQIQANWNSSRTLQAKTIAATFGVLNFAVMALDQNLQRRFGILQFFRRFSKDVSIDERLWGARVVVPKAIHKKIADWIEETLANSPARLKSLENRPSYTIVTDASAFGWGAVVFNHTSGEVLSHSQEWATEDDVKKDASVETETLGAMRAICRFIPTRLSPGSIVRVLTDSVTAAALINKRSSASFRTNQMLKVLDVYKDIIFLANHIDGESNMADGLSRGKTRQIDADSAWAQGANYGIRPN